MGLFLLLKKLKKIIKQIWLRQQKNKFNVRENIYREGIVLELTQVFNEDIDTINNKINNTGILVASKNKKIGQERKMPKEIIDSIFINRLQSHDKHETLNPVEMSIKSNTIVADLNQYKNYRYCLLMNSLLFSTSITNSTNVKFISCNGLNDAKESLINGKLYKVIGIINFDKINNWKIIKGESIYVNTYLGDSHFPKNTDHFAFGFETKSSTDLLSFSFFIKKI